MKVKNVVGLIQGLELAKEILYKVVDLDTALFLSGGSTPRPLYEILAKEEKLKPGAVALVDERFGKPFHSNSNEKMIQETGLPSYFSENGTLYYPILQKGNDRKTTASKYSAVVASLFTDFSSRVAVLGIGSDGHTAGLPAEASAKMGIAKKVNKKSLVVEYNDTEGIYGERVTLTFKALSRMDILLVLVFGEKKKEALRKMFLPGSLKDLPARFYLQKDIAKKTILITDQTL